MRGVLFAIAACAIGCSGSDFTQAADAVDAAGQVDQSAEPSGQDAHDAAAQWDTMNPETPADQNAQEAGPILDEAGTCTWIGACTGEPGDGGITLCCQGYHCNGICCGGHMTNCGYGKPPCCEGFTCQGGGCY